MDPSVPLGAARLLDFVRATEVGTDGRSGYDTIYGHNEKHLAKPVTSMTIDEIQAQQGVWSQRYRSSATGGYQFMKATLKSLKDELGLSGQQVFDTDLQDRLGFHLLKRRGYDQFAAGTIDRTEFARRLSQEWASFPVLEATKGSQRQLKRGQSFYAGDGLNKALVKPERIEEILDEVLDLLHPQAEPELPQEPVSPPAPVALPVVLPNLSPIQATNKANKGGVGAVGGAGGVGTGFIYLWSLTDSFPAEWKTDPQAIIILTGIFAAVFGGICAWLGAYLARDKRLAALSQALEQ